mmetsp:Transcript_6788/g.11323  ORF Transcript_6788/g.11323 Transcript_6788/m.11323 type:complete len:159 (-) Transcript_6788:184-660(-)
MWVACGDYIESRLRAPEDPYEESSCRSFPNTIFCGDYDSFSSSHHDAKLNVADDDTFVEDDAKTSGRRKPYHKYHRRDSSFWSELACGELGDSSVLLSVCSAMCFTSGHSSSDMYEEEENEEEVIASENTDCRYPAIEILYSNDSSSRQNPKRHGETQ